MKQRKSAELEDDIRVTPLVKKRTAEDKLVYYAKIRVGSSTYSCGQCVAMDTDRGEFLAEILFIFKDRFGHSWVENRWLYNKDEAAELIPKSGCPHMEDAELFETNDVVPNPAVAILRSVTVLDEEAYRDRERMGTLDAGRDFFCKKFLDVRLRRFIDVGRQEPRARLKRGRRYSRRVDQAGGDTCSSEDMSSDEESISGSQGLGRDRGIGGEEDHANIVDESRRTKRSRSSTMPGAVQLRKTKDKFSLAMEKLHVTAVPKSLPCRTKERDSLLYFLRSNVRSGGLGNALFVAGMPGTGKTATAHEVVAILRGEEARGELPAFNVVEINGMRLVKPHQAYTQLWMALGGEVASSKKACARLDRHFSTNDPSREFVLLIVDELDYMTTRKQTVLYNLFEWPSRPNSRLVVVGIANTMDLPERCMPRVSSRLTSRLTFKAYTKQELTEIVKGRLAEVNISGDNAFRPAAITMAAAKVAAASGDMRTCLKFCCRAIEVCKARVAAANTEGSMDEACEVSVEDVRRAVSDINQQGHLLAVKHSAPQEKLLLAAICCEIHRSGRDLVEASTVRDRMGHICRAHPSGPKMPNTATLLEMLARMGEAQVLILDASRRAPLPDVQLNMTLGEVVQMLAEDVAFSRRILPESLLTPS